MVKRTIRRDELLKMVPLSDSTIYHMEKDGRFPKRFALTPRCVVWDYDDIVAWLDERKKANEQADKRYAPDVYKRLRLPVHSKKA